MSAELTLAADYAALDAEIGEAYGETSRSWLRLATALRRMRDEHLYKAHFSTFEEYCQSRHGFTRQYAYRLTDAADMAGLLAPGTPKPSSERRTRPLKSLPPSERPAAWAAAAERAGGEPTTRQVEAVVAELRPRIAAIEKGVGETVEAETETTVATPEPRDASVLGVDPAVSDAERTEVRGAVWYEPTGDPWLDYRNIAMAVTPPDGNSSVARLTQAEIDRIRLHHKAMMKLLTHAEPKPAPSPVTAILDQAFANDAKREPRMPVPMERGR